MTFQMIPKQKQIPKQSHIAANYTIIIYTIDTLIFEFQMMYFIASDSKFKYF